MIDTADCNDPAFRVSVYQAGHAITAHLLAQKILYIQMLPHPPMTVCEKPFTSYNWNAYVEILEIRVLELFGGQSAENIVCASASCSSGDSSRIDEITRILETLYNEDDLRAQDILFDLKDRALEMFAPKPVRDAIVPVAEFLFAQERDGYIKIGGKVLTDTIAKFIPQPVHKRRSLLKLLKFG